MIIFEMCKILWVSKDFFPKLYVVSHLSSLLFFVVTVKVSVQATHTTSISVCLNSPLTAMTVMREKCDGNYLLNKKGPVVNQRIRV